MLQLRKALHEIPNPWDTVCRVYFSKAIYTLFVLLTLQIKYQGQANHNTSFENSAINFRNKYFHNSVDWSALYLQVNTSFWFAVDLTIKLPCRAAPNKFTQNNLSSICHENLPSILYGAGHYALPPLKNLVGVYPSIFARKWRVNLAKILNLAKRIVRQNR